MYLHAPRDYVCPICLGLEGVESEDTLIKHSDIIYRDDMATALINSFFVGRNQGHVIVVPNQHYENLFDLPRAYGHRVFDVAQKIAAAMKQAYECDGITLRQNNEPAGDQHAFHYHLHVYPRYKNDGFNEAAAERRLAAPDQRVWYANKLKLALREGLS
jgi:histidine triad (HIT) family protein